MSNIDEIIELSRRRSGWHRAEKSLTLQAKGQCRRFCDGDKKEADKLFTAVVKNKDHDMAILAAAVIMPYLNARDILESERMTAEKRLKKLASELPVIDWVKDIRGFGPLNIALILGESGNISKYSTVSKLWKRMGMAVMQDGKRQRKVAGIDAIEHGYAPYRRSIIWNLGDCIIKGQSAKVDKETGEVIRDAGEYRLVYDERKAYELERDPEMSAGHAHNRAKRYMEKRILRHLWQEWRRAVTLSEPTLTVPVSEPIAA